MNFFNEESVEKPAHSRIGPSSIYRRIACPGSLHQEEIFLATNEITDSSFATEGTDAHSVLEAYLVHGREAGVGTLDALFKACSLKERTQHWNYIEESALRILDYVNDGYHLYCEVRLEELKALHPECFGTSDVVLYHPDKKDLVVIDFKYGSGVYVDTLNEYEDLEGSLTINTQLLVYGYGATIFIQDEYKQIPETIHVGVLQPRMDYGEDTLRLMRLSPLDMEMQIDVIREALKEVFTESAKTKLKVGEQCKFCDAKPTCPAQVANTAEVMNQALDLFGEVAVEDMTSELKDAKKVLGTSKSVPLPPTPEQLSSLWSRMKEVNNFFKSLSAYMYAQAEANNGEKFGVKLVPGKGRRAYVSYIETGDDIVESFSAAGIEIDVELCIEEKVKPFTRLQKDVEHAHPKKKAEIKKVLDVILVKQEGKPTLVSNTDKRETDNLTDKDLFEALNGLGHTE